MLMDVHPDEQEDIQKLAETVSGRSNSLVRELGQAIQEESYSNSTSETKSKEQPARKVEIDEEERIIETSSRAGYA